MVSERCGPVFQTLPGGLKQAITESLLTAWLDKTLQYPAASYFQRGLSESSYRLPTEYLDISGGKVWDAAPRFLAAGSRVEIAVAGIGVLANPVVAGPG